MKYLKKYKLQIILVFSVLLYLLPILNLYQNKVFSPHFVDEEDNLVLGKYLLEGETLYKDLFSHHQPLAYIFSAGVQEATNPNSIYLLIKRHREVIMAWSIIWAVLLCLKFKFPGLLFVGIIEPIKILLLGNLFLSESLSIYPLIFLVGLMISGIRLKWFDFIFIGVCVSLVGFLLSPLWPVLLLLLINFLIKTKERTRSLCFILLGALPISALVLNFISIPDYLHNAFYINFKYYIPITSESFGPSSLLSSFAAPFLSFFSDVKNSQILPVIQLLSFIFITTNILLIKFGLWKKAVLGFIVLGFVNFRFVEIGHQYYSGFHLLPWLATLILLTSFNLSFFWSKSLGISKIFVVIVIIIMFSSSAFSVKDVLFKSQDMNKDFYVNYSRQFDFGNAVKILKSEGDSLFVVPDEWLIYWEADIGHNNKMINYYAWMTEVPELSGIVESSFRNNPPTFFYCSECSQGYFGLEKYFSLYEPLKKDGKITNLLVLKEKIKKISQDQRNQLKYYNFDTID